MIERSMAETVWGLQVTIGPFAEQLAEMRMVMAEILWRMYLETLWALSLGPKECLPLAKKQPVSIELIVQAHVGQFD